MNIVVIIPTYNEAGGIGGVLDELHETVRTRPDHRWMALVVDGNSTDHTREIVRSKQYPTLEVHLLEEQEKSGIARAYATGMTHAMTTLAAHAFVEFDGDGQHDPSALLRMLDALENGAEYVIGSRYIPGGRVPESWAWYRRALSRFGSLYARLLLELPIHDVTSGLKMTKVTPTRKPLLLASLTRLLSREYAYKIQLLTETVYAGARVQEVPISFRTRENDSSKSTPRDIWESLRITTTLRLRHLSQWRLLRVALIGSIGFLVQTTVFELLGLQWAVVSPSTAAVAGALFAILSNFLLNEHFSFADRTHNASTSGVRLAKFYLVSSGSVVVQWVSLSAAEQLTTDLFALRAVYVLGVLVGFLINYTGYYFFVWGSRRP